MDHHDEQFDKDWWNKEITTAWAAEKKRGGRRAYGRRRNETSTTSKRNSKKRALLHRDAGVVADTERSSFSSSTSSSNNENSNPNILLQESSPLPPTKLKRVHDSCGSSSSSSSFSHLAKSGEAVWGVEEEEESLLFGSKRGICASPIVTNSDWMVLSGSTAKKDTQRMATSDSDHEESEKEEEEVPDNNTSMNASFESAGNDMMIASLPPKPVRRSSGLLEKSVFGTTDENDSTNKVYNAMSSLEDLQFLTNALRKEQRGTASFFYKSWTVAPRAAWPPKRRTAFLQSLKQLGFSIRKGGAALAFCQVNATRGQEILKSAQEAVVDYNKQKKDSPVQNETERSSDLISFSPSVQLETERSTDLISFSPRVIVPPLDREVEVDLLQAVDSLTLSDNITTKTTTPPLVRLVTLDSKPPPLDTQHVPTLPCFQEEDDDCDLSFDHGNNSRPSNEHHVGTKDLVQHLHGWSPRVAPQQHNKTLKGASPACLPSMKVPYFSDFVETPLLKKNCEPWGSRTSCSDWQVSTRCEQKLIDALTKDFETRYAASRFASAESPLCDPALSLGLVPTTTNVISSDLGFDYEVDSGHVSKQSHVIEPIDEDASELPKSGHFRRSSVGATAFAGLNLDDVGKSPEKAKRRKMLSFAKRKRMSLCATALDPMRPLPKARQSLFALNKETTLTSHNSSLLLEKASFPRWSLEKTIHEPVSPVDQAVEDPKLLTNIFLFLREHELLKTASLVCSRWADAATEAHASLMLISVGCSDLFDEKDDDDGDTQEDPNVSSIARSMERKWNFLTSTFPWATFLSEGAFKRVYRVHNSSMKAEEAVSVMDVDIIESFGNKDVVGAELAVSVMLSSLVRRNICPNFVTTRGVFTCPYEPPASHWGSAEDKYPKGKKYVPGNSNVRKLREPNRKNRGRYQYIRMELCREGDVEEYIKRQNNKMLDSWEAQSMVFQIAFALHAAGNRYSMKHYDVKLLNVFLQDANVHGSVGADDNSFTVLRYGIGSHVFALRMPTKRALVAKLADYGTANIQADSDGQPVNLSQFTTLENTPPEFMILGDAATQGYGHDCFGLGLCMLHLFTGHAPYEEILDDVTCPPSLKDKLEKIWQDEQSSGYDVIRSVVLADVDVDEDGNIEGEPDPVLYDTFYRYLVLFGIPKKRFKSKEYAKVWHAVSSSLERTNRARGRPIRRNAFGREGPDARRFTRDQKKYSLSHGDNKYIARARGLLEKMDGAMDLLLSLVKFDPQERASPLDVVNSTFMHSLREESVTSYKNDIVHSFMAFSSSRGQC